jgi:hypothetical protein
MTKINFMTGNAFFTAIVSIFHAKSDGVLPADFKDCLA